MSNPRSPVLVSYRSFAAVLGVTLLAYLVVRTGPQMIWRQVQAVGLGLALIIVLAGVAHLLKTWAWRLTFTCDLNGLSWSRSFAMRLVSEAIGQLGVAGKVFGEGMRVSLLGSTVPVANSISSAALDQGLHVFTGAMVTVLGITAALLLAPIFGRWLVYALLFTGGFVVFMVLVTVAFTRRWRFLGPAAKAIARLPGCKSVSQKQSVIEASERNLLAFHREAPAAFWASLGLNFVYHALAVLEVYLILRFMGAKVPVLGALVLEGLTKLINLVGAVNPGNVGTYEGGNMVITTLFGITSTAGLTLALCRRARALFWAAIGAVCLMAMKRPREQGTAHSELDQASPGGSEPGLSNEPVTRMQEELDCSTVIVLADDERSCLARVGTLPVLLRAILTVRGAWPCPLILGVPSEQAQRIRSELNRSRRMPEAIEWCELAEGFNLAPLIGEVAPASDSVIVLLGNRTYQPQLLQIAAEWRGSGALALATDSELAGVYVLSRAAALDLGQKSGAQIRTLSELHACMQSFSSVETREVAAWSWHNVAGVQDVAEAERKLDTWLVKPTDGLFARMNRRVSIPISRQLIKLPITPNMVTFLTLGVSIAAGVCFSRGGYSRMLHGAILSVSASILDGCDGEVARLKLQSTEFGCWLETICDYLYYVLIFAGISVGLKRTSGSNLYLGWGAALIVGAVLSFVVVSFLRRRMAGDRPERFLAVWQEQAETRRPNPLLYLGRHTEFIIRRCFFPYALLAAALLNITKIVFVITAIGANLVWTIALYSWFALSRRTSSASACETRIGADATINVTS